MVDASMTETNAPPEWKKALDAIEPPDWGNDDDATISLHGGDWEKTREAIRATRFVFPDPTKIPPRDWLFAYWFLRGEITVVIAPGGVGKSTCTIGFGLSMVSGQDFLGKSNHGHPKAVWIWNLEDSKEELDRQVTAALMRHGITEEDCGGRLYVDSGLDQQLCTATEGPDGLQIIEPVYDALKKELIERKIDVLEIDPFVSSHEVSENANQLIDKVAKRWKRLAHEANCNIVLVHHSRKTGGREVSAEDGRGAIALINAARSTLVINQMSSDEAERFGITDKSEARRIIRIDDGKPNRAPPEEASWFRLDSVSLGNGDNVGAAVQWLPPDPFDGIGLSELYDVQTEIDAGEYRDNVQARDWAGHAVAKALHLDADSPTDKSKIKSLLREWKRNGSLKVERRKVKGEDKPFLIVGNWVEPADLPTSQSGVG